MSDAIVDDKRSVKYNEDLRARGGLSMSAWRPGTVRLMRFLRSFWFEEIDHGDDNWWVTCT